MKQNKYKLRLDKNNETILKIKMYEAEDNSPSRYIKNVLFRTKNREENTQENSSFSKEKTEEILRELSQKIFELKESLEEFENVFRECGDQMISIPKVGYEPMFELLKLGDKMETVSGFENKIAEAAENFLVLHGGKKTTENTDGKKREQTFSELHYKHYDSRSIHLSFSEKENKKLASLMEKDGWTSKSVYINRQLFGRSGEVSSRMKKLIKQNGTFGLATYLSSVCGRTADYLLFSSVKMKKICLREKLSSTTKLKKRNAVIGKLLTSVSDTLYATTEELKKVIR